MKLRILTIIVAVTVMLALSLSANAIDVGVEDFYSQIGVATSFDLKKVKAGKSVTGVVKNVEVLQKAGGPTGVKNGDAVIFHHLGDGRFRLSFPKLPSKNTLDVKIKVGCQYKLNRK